MRLVSIFFSPKAFGREFSTITGSYILVLISWDFLLIPHLEKDVMFGGALSSHLHMKKILKKKKKKCATETPSFSFWLFCTAVICIM